MRSFCLSIHGFRRAWCLVILISIMSCQSIPDPDSDLRNTTPPAQSPTNWTLVWNDEFDADTIDTTKWEHEVNAWGGGNNELQYYTDHPTNSYLVDGHLIIQADREEYTGPEGTRQYTSARLRTKYLGDWLNGRFEIRAKLPAGQGIWPAIWMLPTDTFYGDWPASGEIDIVEVVGHEPSVVHGTLHFGGEWPAHHSAGASYTLLEGRFDDGFHLFVLEWAQDEFRWSVDGYHYQTQTSWFTTPDAFPAPFDQRFHLILNIAVGGNWPGPPDETTSFPQKMTVDYLRVYQKVDSGE